MKTKKFVLLVIVNAALVSGWPPDSAAAQTAGATQAAATAKTPPPPTPYQVIERGSSHRTWQRTVLETKPDGTVVPHLHKLVELSSGMCFQDASGQWVDSQEQIESTPQGASANKGQYQAIFANNLNSAGAIDQQTRDGKRLRSNILGLAYYDRSSGQSVLIAQIEDSQGELLSANQVLYPNAFTGVKADVRYTYKKGAFEQDVILRGQPPTVESLGLSSQSTEIEVLTEFLNPPAATIVEHAGSSNPLPDQEVSWGAMRLGRGKAFDLGEPPNRPSHVQVRRQYETVNGRTILIEAVPLPDIQAHLQSLPLQSSARTKLPVYASKTPVLTKTPLAATKGKPMKLAAAAPPVKGYVLDYVELNTDQTDFTFQGDQTYLVDAGVNLTGATTFEGGAVIKCDGDGQINIDPSGTINCQTAPYRPAIFTSINDDSLGESGAYFGDPYYCGSPSWGDVIEFIDIGTPDPVLRNFRFSYASEALVVESDIDMWDCQFINVEHALCGYNSNIGLHNVLINEVDNDYAISMNGSGNVIGENVTCDGPNGLPGLITTWPETSSMSLTNCLITQIDQNNGLFEVSTDGVNFTESSIPTYQTVGAGSYYLTNNSLFHNAGTTNVSPALLTDLAGKTTYPPTVYANTNLTQPTVFSPQAQRDNAGNPDFGYHYDPLDYVFGGVDATCNLTFTAGTAVGWYNDGPGCGVSLDGTAQATFSGTATAPCVWARNNMVQEGGNGNWASEGYLGGFIGLGGNTTQATAPTVNMQFTHCYARNFEGQYFRDYGDGTLLVINACNSEFYDGSAGGYMMYFNFTNCLAVRAAMGAGCDCSPSVTMLNCTFVGGALYADHAYGTTWPMFVQNCAFDGTDLSGMNDYSGGNTNLSYCNFNSFDLGAMRTPVEGTNDLTITNGYNWQPSWLGNYYLPTNSPLINAGSTTADKLGLYHFTTQTNQVPETNSTVDIGYHYVATDTNGNPLDSNGNGLPDYLEDPTGTGLPLSITLLAPTNSAMYAEPASIAMQATVFDWSGTVTNVEFYNGSTGISGVPSTPFNYSWPIVAHGSYTVMAGASDNKGATALSAPVSITVTNLCGD
jgi:hypothetical protein